MKKLDPEKLIFNKEKMNPLKIEKIINSTIESAEEKVTEALKLKGFGILTKIDFASKMKEKLNKDLNPTIILGACNPSLAYEAYSKDPNMLLLVPCNVILEQISNSEIRVSMIKPTAMLKSLGKPDLVELAKDADDILDLVIQKL